jgi:hypothetical protein
VASQRRMVLERKRFMAKEARESETEANLKRNPDSVGVSFCFNEKYELHCFNLFVYIEEVGLRPCAAYRRM